MAARPVNDAKALGRAGEDAAAQALLARGYAIRARNWRAGRLELDMVCEAGETLVFVEVKARGPGSLGSPADGLTARKRGALLRAAQLYLARHDLWHRPCRFDVVEVDAAGPRLRVRHVENAFGLDDAGAAPAAWQPW